MKNIFLVFLFLLVGCGTTKPTFTYPPDISDLCESSKYIAKQKIEQVNNSQLKIIASCIVVKVDGTKNFSGEWAWFDQYWKMYVCGLCSGKKIQIACHPVTKGGISAFTLIHEWAHYWLINNYNDYTHDPKYKSYFSRWVEPKVNYFINEKNILETKRTIKDIQEQYLKMNNGDSISLNGIDKNGEKFHVDFIVIK